MRRVRCRHSVTHLSRRNKATSASDRRPSAPWVLSSAGKLIRYLHGSYFLPYRSADVFLFCFLSAISIFLSLGCSGNALSSISWVDTPLTPSFLKSFGKITYPAFNIICWMCSTIKCSSNQIPRSEGYDRLSCLPVCQCMYLHPVSADMIHHQHVSLSYCRASENGRRYYCNIMRFVL